MSKEVGDRIKTLRTERGLSQRELASPGVSYAYISRIENGTRDPSIKALRNLADSLGTTPEFLETGRMMVVDLDLRDFEPWLTAFGFKRRKMTQDQAGRLRYYFRRALASKQANSNPLRKAVQCLLNEEKEV